MKRLLLALSLPYVLSAHTLPELFSALKSHSQTRADDIVIQKAAVANSQATSKLYPKINLYGTYDHYTDPTGMLPVAPNDLLAMVKDQSVGQPFSTDIFRAGANFTMPIFVKSIYTMADKAEAMQKSAKAKKKINLLKNEALIVGSNANLTYLNELERSLEMKEKSLLETQKTLQIKVDSGRAPESALYKIEDGLNQIAISKNSIALKKRQIISNVEAITGIVLDAPIPMEESAEVQSGELASLKPLEEKIKATRLGIRAEKEKLYPSLVAHGNYNFSFANAYNNDDQVNEQYGNIGLFLNIPLLAMDQYDAIEKSDLEVRSDEIELEKMRDELSAKADMLQHSLPLLENSIALSQKSIENKQKLLEIAKVNYASGRLSTEEYLRYEDEVVDAKVKLYQSKAQKWQTLMQLAVIYANNIEEMVK